MGDIKIGNFGKIEYERQGIRFLELDKIDPNKLNFKIVKLSIDKYGYLRCLESEKFCVNKTKG